LRRLVNKRLLAIANSYRYFCRMAKRSYSNEVQHIGQAIQQLLKDFHIKSKFDEANLVASWERLVGKPIARRTRKVFVRNKVVFVELDSPAMKHDLNLHKVQILEIFRKEFGKDAVGDLVIM
jgi:predicted nucleic acid-binding Zn ribbon protein